MVHAIRKIVTVLRIYAKFNLLQYQAVIVYAFMKQKYPVTTFCDIMANICISKKHISQLIHLWSKALGVNQQILYEKYIYVYIYMYIYIYVCVCVLPTLSWVLSTQMCLYNIYGGKHRHLKCNGHFFLFITNHRFTYREPGQYLSLLLVKYIYANHVAYVLIIGRVSILSLFGITS